MKIMKNVLIIVIVAALAGYAGYASSPRDNGWNSIEIHTGENGCVEMCGPGYDVCINGSVDFKVSSK